MLLMDVTDNMNRDYWPSRLYALDVSRGFAALSVVFWHWQHFAYDGNALSKSFIRENQPLYGIFRIFYENGALGVEYFFLLSGFIFYWLYRDSIKNRMVDEKLFFLQRFSRLYPLHFATLILVALLQFLYTRHNEASFVYSYNDSYHFFLNLFFASKWGLEEGWSFNAPVWSVSIEILLYAIFFVTVLFQRGGFFLCLFISATSFALKFIFDYAIFRGLALFFLGGAVFYVTVLISRKYGALKAPTYFATIVTWLSVIVSFYIHDISEHIKDLGIFGRIFLIGFPCYILFPLTISSLALLEIDRKISLRSISWVGDITYSSYLLHFPLQLICGLSVTYGLLERNFYLSSLSLVSFFGVLIFISRITHKNFEMPMQKLIRDQFIFSRQTA